MEDGKRRNYLRYLGAPSLSDAQLVRDLSQPHIPKIVELAKRMPWLAFFLVFFTLSSIGLPGLNGFVSEFLVLLGTATSATTEPSC